MTLRVGDVLDLIDRRAPFRTAARWDAVGLQIGDIRRPVSTAAVVHELTGPIVDRALTLRVGLVVTYHPLVFEPLRSITAATGAEGRSFALVEAGASVISVHTNWDAARGGTADSLAEALGISGAEGFGALENTDGEPVWVGRHGAFAGTAADLLCTVRRSLRARPRAAGLAGGDIRRVAVLPGSGGAHLDDAIATGAEVYVTGDLSHHSARRAVDSGLAVVDAGHSATERPGVRALYDLVAGIVDGAIDLVGIDDDPWEVEWRA